MTRESCLFHDHFTGISQQRKRLQSSLLLVWLLYVEWMAS